VQEDKGIELLQRKWPPSFLLTKPNNSNNNINLIPRIMCNQWIHIHLAKIPSTPGLPPIAAVPTEQSTDHGQEQKEDD
jgi:hypothetical protein